MSITVMKLALEALKEIADETYDPWSNGAKAQRIAQATIPRLEEALTKQEQGEPVDWPMEQQPDGSITPVDPADMTTEQLQFYTTPQQRKPLTDEQIETLWHEDTSCDMPDELKQFKHTARAIEAAHGIKGDA